ncbi:MAG: signal peptidase II [Erysipelotrichaceae bacterium]
MKKSHILIIISGLIIDQLTKFYFASNFDVNQSKAIIDGFFSLTYVRNTGVAWGMFSGNVMMLILIAFAALGFLCYLYYTNFHLKITSLAIVLMISGTLGNLFDRLVRGYVVDFLDFIVFNYDFPVFNVADILLCIGCGLLFIAILLEKDEINGSN